VQGGQDPDVFPVYTPVDGNKWKEMIIALNAADANYLEILSHLGRTHLLLEPFVVAVHNMKSGHPIKELLLQHLEGTAVINYAAVKTLINPGGVVDSLLMGTIESDVKLAVKSAIEPGFNKLMLPTYLASKGTLHADIDYPYRDDGLKLWKATSDWITDFVNLFYADDAAVVKDAYLQRFATSVAAEDGGRVRGFGEDDVPGKVTTKKYLIEALTMIAFTAGCQHAAVNFPQASRFLFPPNGLQTVTADLTKERDYPELLFLPETGKLQVATNFVLGNLYYTTYGDYKIAAFEKKKINELNRLIRKFTRRLDEIEGEINARNAGLDPVFAYTSLLPSKIPQSINI